MKKIIAVTVALAIMVAPTTALAGKKKKGPKPFTSETVSVQMGHPVFNGQSGSVVGLTAQEFMGTCALPASNGFDAYVFEVPADYQKIVAELEAVGAGGVYAYDLDVYTFDSSCAMTSAQNSPGTDQVGYLAKGTAFVLVHNYEPGPIDVTLSLKP
jgi:hypothetical protein